MDFRDSEGAQGSDYGFVISETTDIVILSCALLNIAQQDAVVL